MKILENKNNFCVMQDDDGNKILFSYEQQIATIRPDGLIIYETNISGTGFWKDFSKTTKKHYNQFIKKYS